MTNNIRAIDNGLERVHPDGKWKYPWLQVLGHFDMRALPWECRDERYGTVHNFRCVDDAREFAAARNLDFYL
jgi:hypothetical protein